MLDKSKLETFIRGGEVERHRLNMALANAGVVGTGGLAAGLVTFSAAAWLLSGDAWPLYWKYNVARALDF